MRILIGLTLYLFICSHTAHSQTLSPDLQSIMEAEPLDQKIAVIIELSDRPDIEPFKYLRESGRTKNKAERRNHRYALINSLKEQSRQSQEQMTLFLRSQGEEVRKTLWINNSIAAEVSNENLRILANMPEVANITTDAVVTMPVVVPAATNGIEDNLQLINAPQLWDMGFAGQDTVVAIVDSGVDYLHPDLNFSWRGGSNSWYNPVAAGCAANPASCTSCDLSETLPCDFLNDEGIAHGTGVAGILVGGNAGGTSIGVAPQAKWIAAKVFNHEDIAFSSDILLAFQWLLDPDDNPATDDAPDVVNNSWGFDPFGTCVEVIRPAVQALKAAGILVVFSAGNEGELGSFSDSSPANYPESLAIGSVGTHFSSIEVSDFSSRGPSSCDGTIYPELVAPGFFVRTTDMPGGYIYLSGTSFATSHVAGVLALLRGAFPQASSAEIEYATLKAAQDLGSSGPDNDSGYGLVDVLGAYDWLSEQPVIPSSNAVPPVPTLISPTQGTVVSSAVTFSWRQLPDVDGDAITNNLYISEYQSFTGTTPFLISFFSETQQVIYAQAGGLLLLLGLLLCSKRTKSLTGCLLAVLLLALIVSCGGGSEENSEVDLNLRSHTVQLSAQTTYYWKVIADDGLGGITQSRVAIFSTE
ncbi:MAG: S8 family serine peptidase [Desulfuromusa sp.]|jgi:serine protease AprX|nr:S8 family serine peptidase [Desulfuromusa sp.]